tara:strand:+ start:881 stop:1081 length:201 start_codon:yes stop_codon:yes gene_type:complete
MLPILELNCKIYRHGMYKQTLLQIDPHMKKVDCERLFREGLIYGCGKPFKIIMEEGKYRIEKCEYL